MEQPIWIVLLGDVVDSRSIADRQGFQTQLEGACQVIAARHADDLMAGPVVLKGADEFGAVLTSYRPVYAVVSAFDVLLPRHARFAVARGAIDTGLASGRLERMDGPAFHEASTAMEELKETGLPFAMRGGDALVDRALTDLLCALLLSRRIGSRAEQRAIAAYIREGNQTRAGADLGVSQQAVSDALQRSGYALIHPLDRRIAGTLEHYARRMEGRE